jgi:GH15 family glucan-1,4-alpha-glucosidase
MRERSQQDYPSIEDYGVIGNLRTMALISKGGSIDWCCLPHLDSESVFGALLDQERGGRFSVRVEAMRSCNQRYAGRTNVLVTSQEGPSGRLEIVDFMPVWGDLDGRGGSQTAPEIYRRLHCPSGEVEVIIEWSPRFDYGRVEVRFDRGPSGAVATTPSRMAEVHQLAIGGLPVNPSVVEGDNGPVLEARFKMTRGDSLALVTRMGDDGRTSLEAVDGALSQTLSAWEGWIERSLGRADRSWAGPWKEAIIRSELVLKLLTHDQSGAIAAAATTSLPEDLGGVRNWDYRFAWIRDAAHIARAFFSLGHLSEVDAFVYWAEHVAMEQSEAGKTLPIMFALRPGRPLEEEVLTHFEGYKGSRPVHIGNEAAHQLQLDIYGELLNVVWERVFLEGHFDRDVSGFLCRLADETCRHWTEPDYGIWEVRDGPKPFVYSKLMAWTALERAVRLHDRGLIGGDRRSWLSTLGDIRRWIDEVGFDTSRMTYLRSAGASALDAASLLFAPMGFVDARDPRFMGTIDATLRELTVEDFVYRYRVDDGLPGEEGAFVLCTFWLVDALAMAGRLDEAYRVFENVMGCANEVGLLSEQIDPSTRMFLGNHPQAYSHVGMINSALTLARALQ